MTDRVVEALAAYDDELRVWRVTPLEASQWNDNGTIRYEKSIVDDSNRSHMNRTYGDPVAVNETFEQHYLNTEFARQFPRLRAMQAAMKFLGVE